MKTIGDIGLDLRRALNEVRGYVSAEDISAAVWQASNLVFGHKRGHSALYRPGQPLPPEAYQLTLVTDVALSPFLRTQAYDRSGSALPLNTDGSFQFPVITDAAGKPTIENSFQYPTALYIDGARRVSKVNDNAVQERASNSLTAASEAFPFYSSVPGGYKLYPSTIGKVRLQYLCAPPRPVFAEKESAPGSLDMVYDDNASVDIGWTDVTAINEIKAHATRILAGPVKDAQAGNLATQTAQMGA